MLCSRWSPTAVLRPSFWSRPAGREAARRAIIERHWDCCWSDLPPSAPFSRMASSIPVWRAPYRTTSVASSFGTGASIQSTSARSTLMTFGRLLEQRKSTSARNRGPPSETARSAFASQSSQPPHHSHTTSRRTCRQVVPAHRRRHPGHPAVARHGEVARRVRAGAIADRRPPATAAKRPARAKTWKSGGASQTGRRFGPLPLPMPRSHGASVTALGDTERRTLYDRALLHPGADWGQS